MESGDLSVPMDSQNPGFWGAGNLSHAQRSAIRRAIRDFNSGRLTVAELLDVSDAIREFGVGQDSLPLEL